MAFSALAPILRGTRGPSFLVIKELVSAGLVAEVLSSRASAVEADITHRALLVFLTGSVLASLSGGDILLGL
jgi:hypothetical protein